MIKIKVTIPGQSKDIDISQFTSTSNNLYKDCKFFINSKEIDVDYWFIIENLPENGEFSKINPKNIFFLTAESSLPYDWFQGEHFDLFFSQFNEIHTCHPLYKDNVKSAIPFLPWMINSNHESVFNAHKRDKEFFRHLNLKKKKNISVICSKQTWQDGHKLRFNFVKKLKDYFGDSLDWFGNGINQVPEKWNAIAPYKYHIVLENRSDTNFITEKIYDSFLGGAYPIYWGAPNLKEFFSPKSFMDINILDFKGTIDKIEYVINNNFYDNHKEDIRIAKNLVLDKYNLFERIYDIAKSQKNITEQKQKILLRPSQYFKKKPKFLLLRKYIHSLRSKLKLGLKTN
jgi:hypothetical protein